LSYYVRLGHFTSGNERLVPVNPCYIKFGHVSTGYSRLDQVTYG